MIREYEDVDAFAQLDAKGNRYQDDGRPGQWPSSWPTVDEIYETSLMSWGDVLSTRRVEDLRPSCPQFSRAEAGPFLPLHIAKPEPQREPRVEAAKAYVPLTPRKSWKEQFLDECKRIADRNKNFDIWPEYERQRFDLYMSLFEEFRDGGW